jgi:hypothetical protein
MASLCCGEHLPPLRYVELGFIPCFEGLRDSVAQTPAEPADFVILLAATAAPPLEINEDRQ